MKLVNKSVILAIFGILSLNGMAQVKKEVRLEITKEVNVQEINGVKELTIITNDNGIVTNETFKGEEATKKLAELQKEPTLQAIREEVKVEEINGEKVVTIIKNTNGIETTEVFKGAAADAKLSEIENAPVVKPVVKPTQNVKYTREKPVQRN
jgi:hypothetical protein